MGIAEADHYAILGVGTGATSAEIRRAFRRLALQFHPDRAGADSTPVFQRIARAYAVLSDAAARAVYDTRRQERFGGPTRGSTTTHPGFRPADPLYGNHPASRDARAARLRRDGLLLERLSRPLDDLVAAGIAARLNGDDIELALAPLEAKRGGVALIDMELSVACATCGGIARPGGFWCLRCDSTGRMREVLTVYCAIHPAVADATVVVIPTEAAGGLAPIRLRLRVRPPA